MTSKAGIWCIVVIALVTGRTLIGNRRVCAIERIIIVVIDQRRRCPARIGSMTGCTVRRKAQCRMPRVDGLIVIIDVTCLAIRWRACISIGVTTDTIDYQVGARQWKGRLVVIKCPIRTARRVAG